MAKYQACISMLVLAGLRFAACLANESTKPCKAGDDSHSAQLTKENLLVSLMGIQAYPILRTSIQSTAYTGDWQHCFQHSILT